MGRDLQRCCCHSGTALYTWARGRAVRRREKLLGSVKPCKCQGQLPNTTLSAANGWRARQERRHSEDQILANSGCRSRDSQSA